MEKLSVSIPLQEEWSEQPKVYFTLLKKKKMWKICGINTLRAAVSAELSKHVDLRGLLSEILK